MAMRLNKAHFGELFDFHSGNKDIELGIIECHLILSDIAHI
jgi:hypothetical protein